ncbi:MAG: ORF6N domain-containing protein [Deltaproteobacteria bacterium]|nr:ORF6N domain-containing protein [Deltaproteobacteria bacterium]
MKTERSAELSVPIETVIHTLRGERVILDADLAKIYGVETRVLNQAVRRNMKKFPSDFMFRISPTEARELNRSQTVIASKKHRNPRFRPYAFTEHGAIMAANVLNSPRAVQMSVFVVRAFVRLRQMVTTHKELAAKLGELERQVTTHDSHIRSLFEAIRQLMAPPEPRKRKIGFTVKERAAKYRRPEISPRR